LVDLMLTERFECVVHTAGLIGGAAQRQPWRAVRVNVLATVHLAEAARLAGTRRLVYTSTHGVYDFTKRPHEPMTEESPVSDETVYAACKLSAEHLLRALSRAYALDTIVLRLTNVFGRGLYVGGSTGGEHMNELVRGPALGAVGRILPAVKGKGEWLYIKDAAYALRLACERQEKGGYLVVNIGTGMLSTEQDLVAAVREAIPSARFEEITPAGPVHRAPERLQPYDLTRARETLGYEPRYDLRSAIRDYVREVREADDESTPDVP
jgi:UDP-glucose 4-epimerase